MNIPMIRRLATAGCAALIGLAGSALVRAEPDVLERPSLMRVAERAAGSVLLSVTQASERLVAAGERGVILWSDDDGQRWQQAQVPVSVSLTSVTFVGEKLGWAAGHSGTILRTVDGGQTWSTVLEGRKAAQLVLDAGRVSGDQRLVAEAERLVADGPDKPFLDIHFFDERNGLVVGAYGLIFSSRDGGDSWLPLQGHIDNPRGLHFYRIHADGDAVYLAGEQGSLFISENRGASFRQVQTPYSGTYFGALTAGANLIAFGMRGNAYWSEDRGATWHKSDIPGNNTLTAGIVTDGGTVILVDDGGNVYGSSDQGRNFVKTGHPKFAPLSALAESRAGDLIFAGVRGINRSPSQGTKSN